MSSKWFFLPRFPTKAARKILFYFLRAHMPSQFSPPEFDNPKPIYSLVKIKVLRTI